MQMSTDRVRYRPQVFSFMYAFVQQPLTVAASIAAVVLPLLNHSEDKDKTELDFGTEGVSLILGLVWGFSIWAFLGPKIIKNWMEKNYPLRNEMMAMDDDSPIDSDPTASGPINSARNVLSLVIEAAYILLFSGLNIVTNMLRLMLCLIFIEGLKGPKIDPLAPICLVFLAIKSCLISIPFNLSNMGWDASQSIHRRITRQNQGALIETLMKPFARPTGIWWITKLGVGDHVLDHAVDLILATVVSETLMKCINELSQGDKIAVNIFYLIFSVCSVVACLYTLAPNFTQAYYFEGAESGDNLCKLQGKDYQPAIRSFRNSDLQRITYASIITHGCDDMLSPSAYLRYRLKDSSLLIQLGVQIPTAVFFFVLGAWGAYYSEVIEFLKQIRHSVEGAYELSTSARRYQADDTGRDNQHQINGPQADDLADDAGSPSAEWFSPPPAQKDGKQSSAANDNLTTPPFSHRTLGSSDTTPGSAGDAEAAPLLPPSKASSSPHATLTGQSGKQRGAQQDTSSGQSSAGSSPVGAPLADL